MDSHPGVGDGHSRNPQQAARPSREPRAKPPRGRCDSLTSSRGLGDFMSGWSLGHECVFASELDTNLQKLYEKNFGVRPHGDIRAVSGDLIPAHDILCAGSPCQPFSKAGEQQGFECPKWGDFLSMCFVSSSITSRST